MGLTMFKSVFFAMSVWSDIYLGIILECPAEHWRRGTVSVILFILFQICSITVMNYVLKLVHWFRQCVFQWQFRI